MSKRKGKRRAQKEQTRFLFQERKSFNCRACGVCCRQWTIYLCEAEIKRLEAIDWSQAADRLKDVSVVRMVTPPGETREQPALARDSAGACIFLEDDGLCLVHRHVGFEAKPLPCRMFPYRLIKTPDGAAVGYSFYCPSVFDDDNRPFEEEDLLREALLSRRLPMALEQEVPIRTGWTVPWSIFHRLEETLDTIMTDEGCIIPVCLLAVHFFVTRQLSMFGQNYLDKDFPFAALAEDALKMAANQHGGRFFERFFRTPFLLYPESLTLLGVNPTTRDRIRYLRLFPQFLLSLGTPSTLSFPEGIPLQRLEKIVFDIRKYEPQLTRFFSHVLFRKDLLVGSSLAQATAIILMAWTLLRWYAKARASLAARDTVELDDVRYAVADVERLFLFHASTLSAPFKHEMYRNLLDFLFSNDTFSASMAGLM